MQGAQLGAWRLHIAQCQIAVQGFCLDGSCSVANSNIPSSCPELNSAVNLLGGDVAMLLVNGKIDFTGHAQGEVYLLPDVLSQLGHAQADAFRRLFHQQAVGAQCLLKRVGVGSPQVNNGFDPSPIETARDTGIPCGERDGQSLPCGQRQAHLLMCFGVMFPPFPQGPVGTLQLGERFAHLFESALGLVANGVANRAPVDFAHGFGRALGSLFYRAGDFVEQAPRRFGLPVFRWLLSGFFLRGVAARIVERVNKVRRLFRGDHALLHQMQNSLQCFVFHRVPPFSAGCAVYAPPLQR
ncbi:hypothetical protein HRbin14_02223 [bacterium HR14]|nr:hypothetical protein HRbin14_02223 [bacterium HR14]